MALHLTRPPTPREEEWKEGMRRGNASLSPGPGRRLTVPLSPPSGRKLSTGGADHVQDAGPKAELAKITRHGCNGEDVTATTMTMTMTGRLPFWTGRKAAKRGSCLRGPPPPNGARIAAGGQPPPQRSWLRWQPTERGDTHPERRGVCLPGPAHPATPCTPRQRRAHAATQRPPHGPPAFTPRAWAEGAAACTCTPRRAPTALRASVPGREPRPAPEHGTARTHVRLACGASRATAPARARRAWASASLPHRPAEDNGGDHRPPSHSPIAQT